MYFLKRMKNGKSLVIQECIKWHTILRSLVACRTNMALSSKGAIIVLDNIICFSNIIYCALLYDMYLNVIGNNITTFYIRLDCVFKSWRFFQKKCLLEIRIKLLKQLFLLQVINISANRIANNTHTGMPTETNVHAT